jgi:hypothetical protein
LNYSEVNEAEIQVELDGNSSRDEGDIILDTGNLSKKRKRRGMKIKRGINCSWTVEEVYLNY